MKQPYSSELWKSYFPFYLVFVLAFPLSMVWVETHALHGPTICLFRQLTGLDCPSCGLTRAFRAMGHLDVIGAFRYNPLGPLFFSGTVIAWVYATAQVLTRGKIKAPCWWLRWRSRLFYLGVTLFLVLGFARILFELRHPPAPPKPIELHFLWWSR